MMLAALAMSLAMSANKPHTYKLIGGPTNKVYRNLQQCEIARRAAAKRLHAEARAARTLPKKRRTYHWVVEPLCAPWS
jgi:hypothetical protein